MAATLELRQAPELLIVPERTARNVHGTGVFVVDPETVEVLLVEELVDKPATGRKRGELSILFETAKSINGQREPIEETVKGGLAEGFSDTYKGTIPLHLPEHISYIPDNSYHNGLVTHIGNTRIDWGIFYAFYTGPKEGLQPYNGLEVRSPQWAPFQALLGPNIRSLSRLAAEHALSTGSLERNLQLYFERPDLRTPLLDPEHSVATHYQQREQYPDMK